MNAAAAVVGCAIAFCLAILLSVFSFDLARRSVERDCETMGQTRYSKGHIECKVLAKIP